MTRRGFGSGFFRFCLVLASILAVTGFAAAQSATPPAPPSDAPPQSLQQPAPENDVRAVRLSNVYGSVKVLSDDQVAFQQAEMNMPLVQGMKIVTAADGRAEIEFEDGSIARVTPNSSLTLTQLAREGDGTAITTIEADSGLTYYELDGRAGQYTVSLGGDKVTPIDDAVFRVDMDSSPTELAVMHGSVRASNEEGLDAEAHTNQTLQLDANNPNEYQLLDSIAANSWDQWNSDRDEAMAQVAANASDNGNAGTSQYGDLNAYGDWYNVPGYGTGWVPSDVGEDWDPYGTGSWGYYGGVGYTWISPYPWGWLPYHCGSWSWFDGFGWMWFPGDCGWGFMGAGFGWYPYGTIWAVPPGYVCPRRPRPIHPRNGRPIHNPKHGPVPAEPLIAINRAQQFATVPTKTTGPRVLHFGGSDIAPLAGAHERQGFANSGYGMRAYPGSFVRPAYGPTYRPGTTQPVNRPGTVYRPEGNSGGFHRAPIYRAPTVPAYHPPAAPAYHAPAPVYHAPPPPPAFHAPAPAGHPR